MNICFLSGARIAHLINFSNIVPIMLALCLMLLVTYYALNYAGIIGRCLASTQNTLKNHFSNYVLQYYKSHIEVQASVNNIKTLGTSNASTVYSVTILFPGPLMKCSFLRNHRLVLGPKCTYNYKVRS